MAIRFLSNNLLLTTGASVLTVSSQELSFPATNSVITDRNRVWRTPTLGGFFNIANPGNSLTYFDGVSQNVIVISISAYSLGSLRTELNNQFSLTSAAGRRPTVTVSSSFFWTFVFATTTGEIRSNITLPFTESLHEMVGFNTATALTAGVGSTVTGTVRAIHSEEFITFDLGSAQTATHFCAIDRLRLGLQLSTIGQPTSGQLRIQGSNTTTMSPTVIDTTLTSLNSNTIFVGTFAATSARYWRVLVRDRRNTDGFIQLGYVSLGVPFQPTSAVAPSIEWIKKREERSLKSQAISGQEFYDVRDQRRIFDIELELLTNADHDSLETLYQQVGIHTPFFLIQDSEAQVSANLGELTIYGRFSDDLEFQYRVNDLYDLKFTFNEAL